MTVPNLTEHLVTRLLNGGGVVRGSLHWRSEGGHARARADVDNRQGEPLLLEMHISEVIPWKYSISLMWSKRQIRRLDVRGSHVNKCDGSDEQWTWETHKHTHTDAFAMAHAYTPVDIPPTLGKAVSPEEYERVFEAFCRECGIDPDECWANPTLNPVETTLHDSEDET